MSESDSSDDDDTPVKLSEFSPFALESALPDGPPSRILTRRLRWHRVYWWLLLLFFYSALKLIADPDRELSSAVRLEIIEELFPDWNKALERMNDGPRQPALKELLHAYDVAAILTLYNDLCREEGSTSHSIKDSWECKLYDIKVTSPSGDVEWDPVMNRAPPDSDKDSVLLNGTRGLFESAAAKDTFLKGLAGQRAAELQHICSDRFFQTHVVIGDDPHKVPFGDTEAFAKVVPEVRLGLDQAFDEYSLKKDGLGSVLETVTNIEREQQELLARFQASKAAPTALVQGRAKVSHLSTRLQRRSPWLLDVDQEPDAAKPPESLLERNKSKEAEQHRLHELSEQQVSDGETYGTGCFDPKDVAGLLRDLWARHAGNLTEGLPEEQAKEMVHEVLPQNKSDAWTAWASLWRIMDSNDDGKFSPEEFLEWAELNMRTMQWPIRGYLNPECRNHHFGLICLCKPKELMATYQVAFVRRDRDGVRDVGMRMSVRMRFTQIPDRTGWYETQLRIFTKGTVGNKSCGMIFLMFFTLILFAMLALWDTLLTLAMMPLNIFRITRMDLPSQASYQEISHLFWAKILKVMDGRGVLGRCMPALTVAMERVVCIVFFIAFVGSVRQFRRPSVQPMGPMSDQCIYAMFLGNKDWIVRSLTGENVQHGLTMLTYINECTDLRGISYFGEVTYQIVFQEDGNVHALVVGLIFLRVLEGFSLSKRLSWLPRTIFLAKNKLFNFVLAYVCLVAGFALLMTLYFGDLFQQYCTLASSCYTLLLFSFGLSERAMYGAEPFVERSSTHLLFMLFLFTVFVVTIILNMFTTIVIDAFAAESDPKRYQAAYKEEITTLTNHLLTIFGKGDLVSKRKSLRSTRHVPALPSEGEARSRASDASDASDAGDAGDAVPEQ